MRNRRNKRSEEFGEPCEVCTESVKPLLSFKPKDILSTCRKENISAWFLSGYYFCEYFRPQSLWPDLYFLPWAQIFILLAAVCWVLDSKRGFYLNSTFILVILINLLVVASLQFWAYAPELGWRNIESIYTWAVVFFLTVNICNNRVKFWMVVGTMMLASLKMSLFGARTWVSSGFSFSSWGIAGPGGFLSNSGEYSVQMLIWFALAYWFVMAAKPYLSKWMFRLAVLAGPTSAAMSIMAASSRGAQLALLFLLYYIFMKGRLRFRTVMITVVLGVVVYFALPAEQQARFTEMGTDRTSIQRLLYWEHGIDIVERYPALGIGYFGFIPYYNRHWPQDVMFESAELPHNIIIQVATDTGLIGLSLYFLLVFRALRMAKVMSKPHIDGSTCVDAFAAKALAAGLWGFLIAGQFVTITYYPFLWVQVALITSLWNISKKTEKERKLALKREKNETYVKVNP